MSRIAEINALLKELAEEERILSERRRALTVERGIIQDREAKALIESITDPLASPEQFAELAQYRDRQVVYTFLNRWALETSPNFYGLERFIWRYQFDGKEPTVIIYMMPNLTFRGGVHNRTADALRQLADINFSAFIEGKSEAVQHYFQTYGFRISMPSVTDESGEHMDLSLSKQNGSWRASLMVSGSTKALCQGSIGAVLEAINERYFG